MFPTTIRLVPSLLIASALGGCDPSSSDKDSGDSLLGEDLVSGCVPVDDQPQSWNETLTFTSPDTSDARASFTSPMTRGHGILRAEVSWSAYAGGPEVGFINAADSRVSAHVYPEDTPSMVAEASLGAGESIDLQATQFGTGLDEEYPITLNVAFAWTPVSDCWEDNSTPDTPVDLPLETTAEAHLVGTHAAFPEDTYYFGSTDDFYQVRVPEGASTLTVDASFASVDGSIAVAVFPLGEDPCYRTDNVYAGGSSASTATLETAVEPGDYVIAVQKWEGGPFETRATRTDDGPTRPDFWQQSYTVTASVN
jgi:hypothetical protein